jgi:hypothetical protein
MLKRKSKLRRGGGVENGSRLTSAEEKELQSRMLDQARIEGELETVRESKSIVQAAVPRGELLAKMQKMAREEQDKAMVEPMKADETPTAWQSIWNACIIGDVAAYGAGSNVDFAVPGGTSSIPAWDSSVRFPRRLRAHTVT